MEWQKCGMGNSGHERLHVLVVIHNSMSASPAEFLAASLSGYRDILYPTLEMPHHNWFRMSPSQHSLVEDIRNIWPHLDMPLICDNAGRPTSSSSFSCLFRARRWSVATCS